MTQIQKLRKKWLPIFKGGNISQEQLTEYEQDVKDYKQLNPMWHHYIN